MIERDVLVAVEVLYQCFGEILSWTILHTVDIFCLQNQSNGASFVCEDCFKFLKCLIINLNGFCTSFKGHTTCNVYFATRCVVLNDVIDCHQCCQVFIRVYLFNVKIKVGDNWIGDLCSFVDVNLIFICEFVCFYGIIGQLDG